MNKTFLTLAMGKGLDLPIINPNNKEMMDAVACFHQLKNIDEGSAYYIRRFADAGGSAPAREQTKPQRDIAYCIAKGLGEGAAECTRSLLESVPPLEIVSGELIPALDKVGADYEAGKLFLPQLMQAAEAAKAAFDVIRKHIAATGSESVSRGTIVIATVKGDVHDIGKNIVKVVLENYGYTMIDLGRDVDPELVALTAQRENAKLVGLSALMTTTVKSMEETIKLLRALDCKVMVGGAVLTSDYAEEIGADFYAKDPQGAVAIANKVFGY